MSLVTATTVIVKLTRHIVVVTIEIVLVTIHIATIEIVSITILVSWGYINKRSVGATKWFFSVRRERIKLRRMQKKQSSDEHCGPRYQREYPTDGWDFTTCGTNDMEAAGLSFCEQLKIMSHSYHLGNKVNEKGGSKICRRPASYNPGGLCEHGAGSQR